jgi:hypothetical protein
MFLEITENIITTYKNLGHTTKAVLKGKFMAMSTYIKKEKDFNNNTKKPKT